LISRRVGTLGGRIRTLLSWRIRTLTSHDSARSSICCRRNSGIYADRHDRSLRITRIDKRDLLFLCRGYIATLTSNECIMEVIVFIKDDDGRIILGKTLG